MSSDNSTVKPRRKTSGFASRLLHKELTERVKRPSIEMLIPAFQASGGASTAVAPEKKSCDDTLNVEKI
ncbi:MAG: hypothetical protein K8F91_20835 [Candidatus Obscuribacterales bacterium]|nr:hypothetical protein [Candidatus Obscuribacterales bacterium]